MKNRIWVMPENRMMLQIAGITIVNIASVVLLLVWWNNIEINHKSILLPLPVVSFVYLSMLVKYIEVEEDQFYIKTVFESKPYEYKNISSIEVKGDGEHRYLKVKMNKPLYIRKTITFHEIESQHEVIELLRSKIK